MDELWYNLKVNKYFRQPTEDSEDIRDAQGRKASEESVAKWTQINWRILFF